MALCRRCGNSYDIDFEPALTCHDDWELFTFTTQPRTLEVELLDLTDAWHDGRLAPDVQLEDVIRARTGWSRTEYDAWVVFGIHAEVRT